MDAGLDTGDMLLSESMAIAPADTTGSLHDKLAQLGGRMIVEALELAACGGLHRTPQPQSGASYAHKIDKAEAAIDWSLPAETIARRIRAFDPFPGAQSVLDGENFKLWQAQPLPQARGNRPAGEVVSVSADGIHVQCGEHCLRVTQLQRPGGKRLPVAEFLRGFDVRAGMRFAPRESPG
jgi:methionyl-tRNA formyltransferase